MRALLSSVGTRGDVQPVIALAVRLRALGHDVRLCVPPNFVEWVRGLGFEATPVGVEMRYPPKRDREGPSAALTAEQIERSRASMPDLVTNQFDAIGAAAEGCDVILGGNAHQYAMHSIAELRGIPCVTALYAPVAIPSPDHPPPPGPGETWSHGDAAAHDRRWADNLRAWNDRALERVNHNRAHLGLPAIDDVLRHNIGPRPWLATDPPLAPAPAAPGLLVFQTGAWLLEDTEALPRELEAFVHAGEPPVYVGFGSMPAGEGLGRAAIEAARALGRRVILSRGWAELDPIDGAGDCIGVGDVNQQALFPRVAAVVHHGGAGTTAVAARAGVPQVLAPMFGDQFYWASRVEALGIGASAAGPPTAPPLATALERALQAPVPARAAAFAQQLHPDGAMRAAWRLVDLCRR
ncbi:MAG: glycosyltransferase family 1 protein [Myxococcales bacterium]|nr:glycosyltransferase family 1 protein [Myxococcales bacterium]